MRVLFLLLFLCVSTVTYAESNDPVTVIKEGLYYPGSAKIGAVKQKNFKGISYACVTVTAKNGEGAFKTQVSMAAKESGEWHGTNNNFKSMGACLGMTNDLYYNWKKEQAYWKKQEKADKKQKEADKKQEEADWIQKEAAWKQEYAAWEKQDAERKRIEAETGYRPAAVAAPPTRPQRY